MLDGMLSCLPGLCSRLFVSRMLRNNIHSQQPVEAHFLISSMSSKQSNACGPHMPKTLASQE
jgi:hypothetical protein